MAQGLRSGDPDIEYAEPDLLLQTAQAGWSPADPLAATARARGSHPWLAQPPRPAAVASAILSSYSADTRRGAARVRVGACVSVACAWKNAENFAGLARDTKMATDRAVYACPPPPTINMNVLLYSSPQEGDPRTPGCRAQACYIRVLSPPPYHRRIPSMHAPVEQYLLITSSRLGRHKGPGSATPAAVGQLGE